MSATGKQPIWHQPSANPDCNLPPLKIWNSLTRSKALFIPKDPDGRTVTWYTCGPTVYDDAHIGHARNYVTTDIIRRIMRDYFHFDVKFVMNITDVDDKIIVRARQQHLFADYKAKHPVIDADVIRTAQSAFSTFVKKKLPLLSPDVPPSDFQKEAEKKYAFVLNGGMLEENKKSGTDETKIKMHIKNGSLSGNVIAEVIEKMDTATEVEASQAGSSAPCSAVDATQSTTETFYKVCEDIFLVHLDSVDASSISGHNHSLFENLTKRYEIRFMEDMRKLNVLDPNELIRVTEYIPQIINFVKEIVSNKLAYATSDGSVYFDIKAFEKAGHDYAKLEPWNRNDKDLQRDGKGDLTRDTTTKRSKNDFVLWKASRPGEPSWSSPWGNGRPGWHIECSAMASTELGSQMDIHSGGIDLAFPHHDNELAQSEAYWQKAQSVNYFLHMGHLLIKGAKMSKSLKSFTTIREALDNGTWTSRSLRIVFLLGGWREGIEITEDMISASKSWEEKLNNFFLKVKNLVLPQKSPHEESGLSSDDSPLSKCLRSAQDKAYDALCNSFDTPSAMNTMSELVSNFNSAEISDLNRAIVELIAKWITSMVNIFGLNGSASPSDPSIGWSGIDIPEYARPYLNTLSVGRDIVCQLLRLKSAVYPEELNCILLDEIDPDKSQPIPDQARPYADLLSDFKVRLRSICRCNSSRELDPKKLLALCDRIRDVDLFNLGVYLEDQEKGPPIIRPVTSDLIRNRARQAEINRQKEQEKERRQKAREKAERGKLKPDKMFQTSEFGAWDRDGLPLKDSAGTDITKDRSKKLRKDWERQKKLHEAWIATNVE